MGMSTWDLSPFAPCALFGTEPLPPVTVASICEVPTSAVKPIHNGPPAFTENDGPPRIVYPSGKLAPKKPRPPSWNESLIAYPTKSCAPPRNPMAGSNVASQLPAPGTALVLPHDDRNSLPPPPR